MKTATFSSGSNNCEGPSSYTSLDSLASFAACSAHEGVEKCAWGSDGSCGGYEPINRPYSAITTSRLLNRQHYYSAVSLQYQTVLLVFYLVTFLAFSATPVSAGIDCFKCVSLNGDNPSCEDPFHNNYSVSILESPCMGGRKGRDGLFPATACIKLAGRYSDTGESMVVRTCAVDSGTLTLDTELARMSHCGFFYFDDRDDNSTSSHWRRFRSRNHDDTGETITVRGCALDSGTLNVDTEIIRMSHCGHFWFDDRYVKGCLQSCDDADGCNGSSRPKHFSTSTTVLLLITSIGLPAYFLTNLVYHFQYGVEVL